MKLKFVKAVEIDRNVKAAIHGTGKLGFSSEAIKKMNLADYKGVLIALNEEENDENLYIQLLKETNEDTFNLSKAGDYYYVNTKAFFDSCQIDYRKTKIIYDIVDFDYEGNKMYKLIKREIKKKKQE